MKRKFVVRMLAAALIASVAVPAGSVMIPQAAVVAQAAQEAESSVTLKTAPRITGVSGSEASSWSPATVQLAGISKYDDAQSAWIDAIEEVTVNGTVYTRAEYDSLNTDDTKKYAISYAGMQIIAAEIQDGDTAIQVKAAGYKTKEVVVTRTTGEDGVSYVIKSQKDGDQVVDADALDKTTLENALIDAKALKQGDQSDERWTALQDAIQAAQTALDTAETADDITAAVTALNKAMKDFSKSTKGPAVDKVYYNEYNQKLEIAALGKTYSDDDYIDNIHSVTINGTEYTHASYDAFSDDESTAALEYAFAYGAMQIGTGAFKDGDNTIVITSNGYDKKTIQLMRNGDTYTFASQTDGEGASIQNPTEDGVYTVTFTTTKEDSDEESMIGSYFDRRAKVTVADGKMKISFLNTALKSFLLDFSVTDSKGNYPESERKDFGELNASNEYECQEFTIPIDDLTGKHKGAALVTAMGGQKSDINDWDKYTKADIEFTSVTKGWDGYQKEIDDAAQVIGSELTEKVLIEAGYDTDNDGKISKEELQSISGELDLSHQNLTDVSMLKDLSDKVTTLDLSGNKIKELPAGLLDNMTNLVNFYIENNFVSQIPDNFFAKNTKLDWVTFAGNKLQKIQKNQVSGLSALTILDLSSNEIASIEAGAFDGLTSLQDLGLMENNLSDLPSGLLKPMSKSLLHFSMYGNGLTKIPDAIMDLENVKSLSFFANDIQDISNISFAKFKNLDTLDLQYNQISKLGAKAFVSNKNLNALDLYDNCLTDFSTDMLPAGKTLQKLDIRLNNIRVVDPALRSHAQSYNKFYPQKTVANLKVTNDGTKGIRWSQDLSTLDVIFWLDQTMSDRTNEITSADDYKTMLKDNGWDQKDFTEVLFDKGYNWDVYTQVQKKNADGTYQTVWEEDTINKAENVKGSYQTTSYGTYRVVKMLYTTFNSAEQYRMTLYSNDYNFTKDSGKTTVKVAAPTSVKASSAAYNKVKVTWKKVSGADGYEVYRYNTKTKKYQKVKTTKSNTYTNGSLSTGTKYTYKVRAYKTVNKKAVYSSFSKSVSAKPALSEVTGLTVKNSAKGKAAVSWKKTSGATGYKIYRSTKKNSGYKLLKTVKNAKTVKYTNAKLKKGKSYYFKVRAYRMVGKKAVYGSYTAPKAVKIKK